MGRILGFIKRISLTQWLLAVVIVLLVLILLKLRTIDETLDHILMQTVLNQPKIF